MVFSVSISSCPVLSRPCPLPLCQGLSCSSEAIVPSAGLASGDSSRIRGLAAHQAPEEKSWLVLGSVSVSAPFVPLCAISVGLWSRFLLSDRCTSSEACRCGVGHFPKKDLGAGWRAAMAGWGLLGLQGAAPGPRLQVGCGTGDLGPVPDSAEPGRKQASMDPAWGSGRGLCRQGFLPPVFVLARFCLTPHPTASATSLKVPVSPLLIMRKPGDPAKGSPPCTLGWEVDRLRHHTPLPGKKIVEFGARSEGQEAAPQVSAP